MFIKETLMEFTVDKKLLKKVCPQCQAEFETYKTNKHFCCAKCRSANWMALHLQKIEKEDVSLSLTIKVQEYKTLLKEQNERIEYLEKLLTENSIYFG
jgi:predicted amidophosphoribosyltransferase